MEKYHAIHGKDISSFDLISTHRLPTVSAAQALDDLKSDPRRFVSTGLKALDKALNNGAASDGDSTPSPGGIEKGQIVEVWGPPGSGKTAFAMQAAANTLRDGRKVVWVDAFHPLCQRRLYDMLSSPQQSSQTPAPPFTEEETGNLLHYYTPTLAHFMALLCKPTAACFPSDTSLIVVDTLSGLINHAFPKNAEPRQTAKGPGPSARRLQALQFLISALQKLSATRDLVILLISQCATRMQSERGATLIPALNASIWEQGIATRLVLFRDWIIKGETVHDVHLVGIQKQSGRAAAGGIGPTFAFSIRTNGLANAEFDANLSSAALTSLPRHKRKLHQTELEIADSEEDEYGWEEEDETEVPRMPPQWQGSEDLLVGQIDDDGDRIGEEASDGELPQDREQEHARMAPGQISGEDEST